MGEIITEHLISGGKWQRYGRTPILAPLPDPEPVPEWNLILNAPSTSGFTLGPISRANFQTFMGATDFTNTPSPNLDVVQTSQGEKVLEWYSPANTMGTGTGMAMFVNLPGKVWADKLYSEYELWFGGANAELDDFAWGWGGKLPGQGGSTSSTGVIGSGNSPSGGTPNTRGFSSRLMWYGPGAGYGGVISSPNELAGYPYLPLQPAGSYGKPVWTNYIFPSRQWIKVRQEYVMNTVPSEGTGNPDGIHRIYVNDVLKYEDKKTIWRIYSNVHVDETQFSLFRGGAEQTWAVPVDTRIRLRKFKIAVAA